ncbi:MAG TPA: peroxiredoxin family protein, partial [Myxococcota bacterium]|nr:peroxiredoxin family protein [Myxococcota bacterium]
RTDHAHMMAARILPDQIHNFAHNNEWLCRNLLFCGRVREAIDLARNMVELPRHPKYNTLNRKDDNTAYDKNNGSSMLGRNRLFDAFLQFELWPELISLADPFYLDPTELQEEQARRFYALALAYFATGRTRDAEVMMEGLTGCRKQLRQERFEAVEKAEATAKKEKTESNKAMVSALDGFKERLEQVDRYQGELKVWAALNAGETNTAAEALAGAEGIEKPQLARLHARLGNRSNVLHYAGEILKDSTNQAPALALAAHLFWEVGETNQATNVLHQLRSFSSRFDLETPVLARLQPIVRHVGLSEDWRLGLPVKTDVGNRPELDALGPFRWEPSPAPDWVLTGSDQKERSLGQYRGRPLLMVFYLGAGCVHCIEQLNLLTPAAKDFQSQGFEIVAVSTESVPGLQKTLQKASQKGGFPFPIVSDEPLTAFKAFRAYDDFEQMPLHGTFLVDGEGRVRWQDIGPDPFTDFKFLVGESRRLLGLTRKLVAAK